MTQFFNKTEEKEKRRILRHNMPPAEVLLWSKLRSKQIGGMKFRRQYSVGPFVVDFYCVASRLAIELDGESHEGEAAADYDAVRQQWIETFDIRFLRFSNAQVYTNLESVLETIARTVEEMK